MKEFAEQLQAIQKQMGITQKKMAEIIGIGQNTLSAYMHDKKTPTLEIAMQISRALKVPIGQLCGEPKVDTNRLRTYEDLLKMIIQIVNEPLESGGFSLYDDTAMNYEGEFVSTKSLKTADKTVSTFLIDYCKMKELLESETIDVEVFNAWLEKRYRDYSKKQLLFEEIFGTNSSKQGE